MQSPLEVRGREASSSEAGPERPSSSTSSAAGFFFFLHPTMASLNWVHLSTASAPLPLPGEKFLLTVPSVSLTLFPSLPGAPTKPTAPSSARHATGTVFVSNQRVVFVSSTASAGGSLAGGTASVVGQTGTQEVQTLSMPFPQFLDGRYVQPWFSATYYEALLLPAPEGGLEVRQPLSPTWGPS